MVPQNCSCDLVVTRRRGSTTSVNAARTRHGHARVIASPTSSATGTRVAAFTGLPMSRGRTHAGGYGGWPLGPSPMSSCNMGSPRTREFEAAAARRDAQRATARARRSWRCSDDYDRRAQHPHQMPGKPSGPADVPPKYPCWGIEPNSSTSSMNCAMCSRSDGSLSFRIASRTSQLSTASISPAEKW